MPSIIQAIAPGNPPDPGAQANLEASLESLSQLADVTVNYNPDGTANVLLGGQTALVLGQQQYSISASFSSTGSGGNANAVPDAQILDSNGQNITGQISQGSLGGLLNVRNVTLPSLQGDSTQQGSLNILAQQVADRVNAILSSANTTGGQPGTALFTYSTASPVDVAATLARQPRDHRQRSGSRGPRPAAGRQRRRNRVVEPRKFHGLRRHD